MASPPFCIKAYLSPWSLSLIGRIQKGGQGAIPFARGRRRYSHAQGNEACALLPPPNFDLSGVHGALLQSHSLIFGAVGAIRSTIAGMHAPASESSILAVTLAATGTASATFKTGNDLYSECTAPADWQRRFLFCYGYIEGIADAEDAEDLRVIGFMDPKAKANAFYLPAGVQAGQLPDVAVQYLQAHPERRHNSAAALVELALSAAFPCR
jgi:Rap1a immunity proteins